MRWALAALAIFVAAPAEADILNLNTGELTITHVADLPEGGMFELGGEPAALGWLHREYSAFDLPVSVFDEHGWVIYREKGLRRDYMPLDAARMAELERLAGADWSAHPPLTVWQRHGGRIALAGIGLFAALRLRPRRAYSPRKALI